MKNRTIRRSLTALFLALCAGAPLAAAPLSEAETHQTAHDIFKQLIEINTTDSVGDNTRAAEAIAARFRAQPDVNASGAASTPSPSSATPSSLAATTAARKSCSR